MAKCDEGGSMSFTEGGMSEAEDKGGTKRKRMDEGMRSEIGAYGEGQVPVRWALTLKSVNEKKSKDSGTFNSGYYTILP